MVIGAVALAIWLGLIFGHGGFWLARGQDDRGLPGDPERWPRIAAVVPARDEAEVIGRSIGSLLQQDYPGSFSVYLVDDGSSDGTADIAHGLVGGEKLTVLKGEPLPKGWTGKLWAVSQGIARAGREPDYLWLTDADIEHAPDTLRTLVAQRIFFGRKRRSASRCSTQA